MLHGGLRPSQVSRLHLERPGLRPMAVVVLHTVTHHTKGARRITYERVVDPHQTAQAPETLADGQPPN
ncbi:hypothetical protein GCM10018966_025920 [Streptomyces yanii]